MNFLHCYCEKIPPGFRRLKKGEILKPADVYFDIYLKRWKVTQRAGQRTESRIYCRKLRATPEEKVVLSSSYGEFGKGEPTP